MISPISRCRRLCAAALLAATVATVVTTTAAPVPLASAADGDPLAGFGVNGVVLDSGLAPPGLVVRVLKVIDDRLGALTMLIAVGFPTASTQPPQFLVKYTPVGARDARFGINGVFALPLTGASDIAHLPDGSIIVAGPTGDHRLRIVDPSGNGWVGV